MNNIQLPSERIYKTHKRQWLLYLLACTAMATGTIVAVLTPGFQPELIVVPIFAVFGLVIALHFIERVRHRTEYDQESLRIYRDEWTLHARNRSTGTALLTVIMAQVPLMFVMDYVPPESSVVGMGCMTIAIGCGAFAASYLYYIRSAADE